MGCTSSKFKPVKPDVRPMPVVSDEPTSDSDDSIREDNKKQPRSSLSDDRIINSQNDVNFVEIQVADQEAFNNLFIQQRQQTINNEYYRSIVESWCPNSLQQLVESIKALITDKSLIDCHWIIFYWITCNIEYDTISYFSKSYADQSAEGVFRTKKGVCAGYANIYKYLCDQLNISCEKVSGYSKGYGFDDREGAPTETDHEWNITEIDGHWYLMESTWGAGHLTDQKVFKRELNSYYFFSRPNEMIYHHLPENEKWQLLQEPIQMKQYMQMPKIHPMYFELNLEIVSPRHQAYVDLLPNESYALVLIRAPADVHLMADLKLHDKKVEGGHRVIFDEEKQVYSSYFAPNTIGKHKITIYGKRSDIEIDTHHAAIDLTLNIEQIPINPISFPEIWKTFFDLNLNVISPQNTHLIKVHNGETHTELLIQTPDDVELLGRLVNTTREVIEGGQQVFYDRHKGLWRCKFAPNCDGIFDAQILAKKKSDTGQFTAAVSFKIDTKGIPTPPLSYPRTWELFHDLDLKIEAPRDRMTAVWSENASFTEILMSAPDDVELVGQLVNTTGEEIEGGQQVFYDRHTDLWRCKFAPNCDGIFDAKILAKKKSDIGQYTGVVSFKIDAKGIPTPPLSYPETWQLFHDLDLKIEAPRDRMTAVWPENAFFTEIRLSAPSDVQLSCSIAYNGVKEEHCAFTQFDNDKQQWQLLFAPQCIGPHRLVIYARRQSDTQESFHPVAQFDLNVTNLQNPIKFPITYAKFQTDKCRIYEPLNGVLKKGAIVPIHCVIPGATDVDLQVDSNWVKVKGYEDPVLKTEITVGSKDVTIYAKYGQNTNYSGLVRYSVE